jgi:phage terminase large subunit-like protein
MEVDQFAGGTLHFIWYDEEPPGNKGRMIHEENEQRLLHYNGYFVFTMTPLLGFGGLTYNLLTDKGKPKQETDPTGSSRSTSTRTTTPTCPMRPRRGAEGQECRSHHCSRRGQLRPLRRGHLSPVG